MRAIDDFLTSQAVSNEADAILVVTRRGVPWEFLPSEFLASAKVWEALAGTVGMTALIRNLARMTRIGAIAPFSATVKRVAARLTDADALIRSRIHPMDIFLALRVYTSGRSQPDPRADAQTWNPVPVICDALERRRDGRLAAEGRFRVHQVAVSIAVKRPGQSDLPGRLAAEISRAGTLAAVGARRRSMRVVRRRRS